MQCKMSGNLESDSPKPIFCLDTSPKPGFPVRFLWAKAPRSGRRSGVPHWLESRVHVWASMTDHRIFNFWIFPVSKMQSEKSESPDFWRHFLHHICKILHVWEDQRTVTLVIQWLRQLWKGLMNSFSFLFQWWRKLHCVTLVHTAQMHRTSVCAMATLATSIHPTSSHTGKAQGMCCGNVMHTFVQCPWVLAKHWTHMWELNHGKMIFENFKPHKTGFKSLA